MSPAKIDDFWAARLHEVAEELPKAGAPRVHHQLIEIAAEENRDDWPSVKWVGRSLAKHRALKDEERAQYRRFTWPGAMETGLLPWEASRVALDVLRNNLYKHRTRPTINYVRWHWRLAQASPTMDFVLRDALVLNLLAVRDDGGALSDTRLDLLLAFEPWRNGLCQQMYDETFPEQPYRGEAQ